MMLSLIYILVVISLSLLFYIIYKTVSSDISSESLDVKAKKDILKIKSKRNKKE